MTTLQAAQTLCPGAGLNEKSTARDIMSALLSIDDFMAMFPEIIATIKNSKEGQELAASAMAHGIGREDFRKGVLLTAFGAYIKAKLMVMHKLTKEQ